MVPSEDINRRFTYHAPDTEKVDRHEKVRELSRDFAILLNSMLIDGREKSLALTHLEEVMMWANASIAREGK